jgi:hypothetical protein
MIQVYLVSFDSYPSLRFTSMILATLRSHLADLSNFGIKSNVYAFVRATPAVDSCFYSRPNARDNPKPVVCDFRPLLENRLCILFNRLMQYAECGNSLAKRDEV